MFSLADRRIRIPYSTLNRKVLTHSIAPVCLDFLLLFGGLVLDPQATGIVTVVVDFARNSVDMEFWRTPLRLQAVDFRSMLARHSGTLRSLNSRTAVPERCLTCLAEAESFAQRACAVRQRAGLGIRRGVFGVSQSGSR